MVHHLIAMILTRQQLYRDKAGITLMLNQKVLQRTLLNLMPPRKRLCITKDDFTREWGGRGGGGGAVQVNGLININNEIQGHLSLCKILFGLGALQLYSRAIKL